jgi:hypothetical protein
MLNILKKKQINFNDKPLNTHFINKEKNKIQSNSEKDEYKNTMYYPSSSKEWFGNVYSYNKSYLKSLIVYDVNTNKLFRSYCNMLQDKTKRLFKRRRNNKSRYSANKIYASRAELNHINTKLFIILYTYNKQKSSIEKHTKKFITLSKDFKVLAESSIKYILEHRNIIISLYKNQVLVSKRKYERDEEDNLVLDEHDNPKLITITTHWNRVFHLLINNFSFSKIWKMTFIKLNYNLLNYLPWNIKIRKLYITPLYYIIYGYCITLKKLFKIQKLFFNNTNSINFNKSKFNKSVLNWRGLGLIDLIQKIYNKKAEIKLVELKSIHLNSDVFSSAIALKLRDRQNKAVRVLGRAVIQMVKIPDLHTLITFDDNMESMNNFDDNIESINNYDYNIESMNNFDDNIESINNFDYNIESINNFDYNIESMNRNNILNTIKQQVVSGVRFEASGRLTRRLTAMRAIFKYRYVGSLKNLRSSFNNKSSTMLRGHVKSNSQYTVINSKTRNGSFGLKGWVSSH